MPDIVKVFNNTVNAAGTTGLGTSSINVFTNNSTTKAVVKDLHIKVEHPTAAYSSAYKYPVKVKVGNFPIVDLADTTDGVRLEGSQIVDSSTSLSVEIQAESQATDYGIAEFVLPISNTMRYYSVDTSALIASGATTGLDILGASPGTQISASEYQGISACSIFKDNQWMYVFHNINSQSQLLVRDKTGTLIATLDAPHTVGGITADATYIYAIHRDSSTQTVQRWRITDFVRDSFQASAGLPAFPGSNAGFIDTYNGFIYLRSPGGSSTVYKINTATFATTTFSVSPAQTETIGGVITVNRSGVPFIVEHRDTIFSVYNLNTNTEVATPNTAFPSEPTTTSARQVVCIGHGLVLVKNGSYSQVGLIDVNGTTPTMTNITAAFPMGSGSQGLMAGSGNFKTAPTLVTRNVQYSIFASGIEIT